jgi:hypothetical protein
METIPLLQRRKKPSNNYIMTSIGRKLKRNAVKEEAKKIDSVKRQQHLLGQQQFAEELKVAMSSWKTRVKFFYSKIPTKKGKRVFWIMSPVWFVFVIVYGLISALKLDIAWEWSRQLYHSIVGR